MTTQELFALIHRALDPGVTVTPTWSRNEFGIVFQDKLPDGGGVYVFSHAPGIFYIGKTVRFQSRPWKQISAPKLVDGGYLFTDSRIVLDCRYSQTLRDNVLHGRFRLDFFNVDPINRNGDVESVAIHACRPWPEVNRQRPAAAI